jgi:hypothetical protein
MRRTDIARPLAVVFFFVAAAGADALEVQQLEITRTGDVYRMEAVAEIPIPREVAFAILTDYEHLDELDPKVLESRLLERPEPNVALVWLRVRGCVAFICKVMEQVERVEERPPDEILVELLPDRSDMKLESAHWRLEPTEEGTRLSYTLELEPGDWVPAFARGAVERQLRSSFRGALLAVERLGVNRMASQ